MKQPPQLPKQVVIILAPVAQTGNQPTINQCEAIIRELLSHREERETEHVMILSQGDTSSLQVVDVISTVLAPTEEGSAATLSRGPDLSAVITDAYETVDKQITLFDTLIIIVMDQQFASDLMHTIDRDHFGNASMIGKQLKNGHAYFLYGDMFEII